MWRRLFQQDGDSLVSDAVIVLVAGFRRPRNVWRERRSQPQSGPATPCGNEQRRSVAETAPIKAIVFDVDGTLYRQSPVRRAIFASLLSELLINPVQAWGTIRALLAY